MKSKYAELGKRFFLLSRPLEWDPFGIVCWKSRGIGNPDIWAEFEVIEDRYKIKDGYKVELKAINPIFGRETYYQCDFDSLIKKGYIIPKTSEKQHVEVIEWMEPLWENVRTKHTSTIVVD